MPIVYITDPVNTGHGSYESEWFKNLENAGVQVVYTDLEKLRDSMPLYSGIYRIFFQWFDFGGENNFPNFLADEAPDVKFSSYLKLLNIKDNHRKTLVTDQAALVTSSNPHAASSRHGNVALKVKGPIQNDVLFDRIWNNADALYTLDVEEYQNSLTYIQRGLYALRRWMKVTTY